jgi:hypothetical protein
MIFCYKTQNPILTKNFQRLYHHGVVETQLTSDYWPGCTGANPGYSMVNVGRRAGGLGKTFRNSFRSNYLSQPLDIWHTIFTCGPILWDQI